MDLNADYPGKPSREAAVSLANHLLGEFSIPTKIVDIEDISSSLFVVLYESLFSDRLPGIIREPFSKNDEIHNCDIVIDVLSNEIIHDSLNHIRGVDIVAGDLSAIYNLLDIFSHLLEYVINKIESDQDETRSNGGTEPATEKIAPTRKTEAGNLKKNHSVKVTASKVQPSRPKEVKVTAYGGQRGASLNKNENRKAYDDHRIISHEEYYAMTYGGLSKHYDIRPLSPIRPDHSHSLLGQKSIDSEFDTDTEKNLQPVSGHPRIAWDNKPAPVRDAHSVTGVKDIQSAGSVTQAVAGVRDVQSTAGVKDVQTATGVRGVQSAIEAAVSATSTLDKDKAATTTTTTATALSSSMPPPRRPETADKHEPLRSTIGSVYYHDNSSTKGGQPNREATVENLPSHYKDLRHLVQKTAAMTRIALDNSPVRVGAERNHDAPFLDEERPLLSGRDARLAQELNSLRAEQEYNVGKKKVAFAASQIDTSDEQRYDPNDDVASLQLQKFSVSTRPAEQTNNFARHLARNRQAELGAAHLVLKNEDLEIRKKHELLRAFYEKDHEEFAENVEYMLGRDHEKATEIEDLYAQICAKAASRKVKDLKVKGISTKPVSKKFKKKPGIGQYRPKAISKSAPRAAEFESEEDVLPFLMDEFPGLHLSEHTWHELWRKGLQQIENLTRAYQEIERKKSRAQTQLSDAAERHGLLSEIMRKQLEHSRRLQEIKEQKQQQIQIKNKSHEKRIQSARARRYYNDYQVRARAKVLKKRTAEEMVFRELFKDTLNIQRERIKDIRKYARDQRKRQEKQRQNEIDSLENYYHNQFDMLADRLARERFETEVQNAAQKQMIDRMKKELRKKMESEIKQYQEQMFRCDDDVHFRQADADRIKKYLHLARYSVKI